MCALQHFAIFTKYTPRRSFSLEITIKLENISPIKICYFLIVQKQNKEYENKII